MVYGWTVFNEISTAFTRAIKRKNFCAHSGGSFTQNNSLGQNVRQSSANVNKFQKGEAEQSKVLSCAK